MRQTDAARAAFCLLFACCCVPLARAQDSPAPPASAPTTAPTPGDSGSPRFSRFRQFPWNGLNVWVGSALDTRSASHNEHIAGALRIVGLQISRDVWRGKRARLAYVGEALPLILVRSGPPRTRIPDTLKTPKQWFNPAELERYKFRSGYGFGLAPFGAEASISLSARTSALVNVTAGALIFTKVVPYGPATKANFTVSPGAALQWEPRNRTRIAFGYTLHHLSNASIGRANPGMNSHMLFLRVSRLRSPEGAS